MLEPIARGLAFEGIQDPNREGTEALIRR